MGFLQDRLNDAKAAVDSGQTEQAAEIAVHALLEGPGTFAENLAAMVEDDER